MGQDAGFNWQENYGVFSVSPAHVQRVVEDVQRQKDHHATGDLWSRWEEAAEVVE
jgi:hypothetical protein